MLAAAPARHLSLPSPSAAATPLHSPYSPLALLDMDRLPAARFLTSQLAWNLCENLLCLRVCVCVLVWLCLCMGECQSQQLSLSLPFSHCLCVTIKHSILFSCSTGLVCSCL